MRFKIVASIQNSLQIYPMLTTRLDHPLTSMRMGVYFNASLDKHNHQDDSARHLQVHKTQRILLSWLTRVGSVNRH